MHVLVIPNGPQVDRGGQIWASDEIQTFLTLGRSDGWMQLVGYRRCSGVIAPSRGEAVDSLDGNLCTIAMWKISERDIRQVDSYYGSSVETSVITKSRGGGIVLLVNCFVPCGDRDDSKVEKLLAWKVAVARESIGIHKNVEVMCVQESAS